MRGPCRAKINLGDMSVGRAELFLTSVMLIKGISLEIHNNLDL